MKALIIGGTGTLGKALTKKLIAQDHEVVCLSRCELKQKNLRNEINSNKFKTVLGDVRDYGSILPHMFGVDVVFHVAAIKHVDVAEENPEECLKTNIQGTINVADAATFAKVRHVVFSSTDKAVEPINVYGMSKAISEKILLHRNDTQLNTKFLVYRWGNVVASNGSAIPVFLKAIKENRPVPITDFEMTRFWIRIEDAVDFMINNYDKHDRFDPKIPPIKAAPVVAVVESLARIHGKEKVEFVKVPMRAGEKIHESLNVGFDSKSSAQFSPEELDELLRASVCLS